MEPQRLDPAAMLHRLLGREERFLAQLGIELARGPFELDRPRRFEWGEPPTTLAIEAACMGKFLALKALLDAGADPNATAGGQSALSQACRVGAEQCAKLLLERGAEPQGPPGADLSPLEIAARAGAVGCCELLLQAGADPFQIGRLGSNAIDGARALGSARSHQGAGAIEAWLVRRELAPATAARKNSSL